MILLIFLVANDKKTSKWPKQERDIMYWFQKLETDLWGMWVRLWLDPELPHRPSVSQLHVPLG